MKKITFSLILCSALLTVYSCGGKEGEKKAEQEASEINSNPDSTLDRANKLLQEDADGVKTDSAKTAH